MGVIGTMYMNAANLNRHNIVDLLDADGVAKILDVGCDDGYWSMQYSPKIRSPHMYGVDVVDERLAQAKAVGVDSGNPDIIESLPYEDNFFDVVVSNQVIEHVANVDKFCQEVHRTLKPGGYAVISTENASSWINVMAVAMG